MQFIGAYLIFMFAVVALGLGMILLGTIVITVGMGMYEGGAWLRLIHARTRGGNRRLTTRR